MRCVSIRKTDGSQSISRVNSDDVTCPFRHAPRLRWRQYVEAGPHLLLGPLRRHLLTSCSEKCVAYGNTTSTVNTAISPEVLDWCPRAIAYGKSGNTTMDLFHAGVGYVGNLPVTSQQRSLEIACKRPASAKFPSTPTVEPSSDGQGERSTALPRAPRRSACVPVRQSWVHCACGAFGGKRRRQATTIVSHQLRRRPTEGASAYAINSTKI